MAASVTRHLRRNLVAYLALLFALSSTSYAAATRLLPPNSVGSRQVINGSLLKADFKSGQLPRGARGPADAAGATGPAGSAGPAGLLPALLNRTKRVLNLFHLVCPGNDAIRKTHDPLDRPRGVSTQQQLWSTRLNRLRPD